MVQVIYLRADEEPEGGPYSLIVCDPESAGHRFVHHAGSVTHYVRPDDLERALPEIVKQATSCGHQAVYVKNSPTAAATSRSPK